MAKDGWSWDFGRVARIEAGLRVDWLAMDHAKFSREFLILSSA